MIVYTRNKEIHGGELRIVWEFNPHYRGRRFWWLWQYVLPYIIINRWFPPRRLRAKLGERRIRPPFYAEEE
jgi:hypothetical protein